MGKRLGDIKHLTAVVAAVFAAMLLTSTQGGCARHTEPIVPAEQMRVGEPEFAVVWEATTDVLRRYNFKLDRQDRRAGIITTEPLLGRHWFEFWRKDAVTSHSVAEGTAQTIYRTVTVEIARSDGQYEPVVRVELTRSDRPEPQVTSTSEAFGLFHLPGDGGHRRRVGEGDPEGQDSPTLTPLGRDEDLEQVLLAEIRQAAESR